MKGSTVDHQDYEKALRILVANPMETIEHPTIPITILGLSLLLAIVLGIFDGQVWLRSITWWELIALFDTAVFAIFYFLDLKRQTSDTLHYDISLLYVGIFWLINFLLLVAAASLIIWHDLYPTSIASGLNYLYTLYLGSVIISFGIFTWLDFRFATSAKRFTKIREYWTLLFFVDAPATAAFFFLLLLYVTTGYFGRTLNLDIFAGAVVMQILIADTLFLVVASNLHNHILMRLCRGVNAL